MLMGKGVLLQRKRQKGIPPKRPYFAVIGSYSVKTVANIGTDMASKIPKLRPAYCAFIARCIQ